MSTEGIFKTPENDEGDEELALTGQNWGLEHSSVEEQRELLKAFEQSKRSAAKEAKLRSVRYELEHTKEEELPNADEIFKKQEDALLLKGTTVTKIDEDCVVIREVSTPRSVFQNTPKLAPSFSSRLSQSSQRVSHNSAIKSPSLDPNNEMHQAVRRTLYQKPSLLVHQPTARRSIHELNCKTASSSNLKMYDHTSNTYGIDVLNCDNEPQAELKCEKKRKFKNEVPFYVMHKDMNHNDYLACMKNHLRQLSDRIVEKQRKSLNFKPWGSPIQASTASIPSVHVAVDTATVHSSEDNDTLFSPQERYNLRGRNSKRNNDDFGGAEESAESEDELIPKNKFKREIPQNKDRDWSRSELQASFSEFENEISVMSISDTQMRSKRGREMLKNVNLNKTEQNATGLQKSRENIESDSDSDFEFPGKDLCEPNHRLSQKKELVQRVAKKREHPLSKSAGWQKTTADFKEDISKPIQGGKKKRLMNENNDINKLAVKRKILRKMTKEEVVTELEIDDDDEVECPLCKKPFGKSVIEEHASQCCDIADV